MQKSKIKCCECKYCKETRRWGNTRSEFSCNHPDKSYISHYFKEHQISKNVGFIAFGKAGSSLVPVKRSPAWCPKKKELL